MGLRLQTLALSLRAWIPGLAPTQCIEVSGDDKLNPFWFLFLA